MSLGPTIDNICEGCKILSVHNTATNGIPADTFSMGKSDSAMF
jgi:hypothetical protein